MQRSTFLALCGNYQKSLLSFAIAMVMNCSALAAMAAQQQVNSVSSGTHVTEDGYQVSSNGETITSSKIFLPKNSQIPTTNASNIDFTTVNARFVILPPLEHNLKSYEKLAKHLAAAGNLVELIQIQAFSNNSKQAHSEDPYESEPEQQNRDLLLDTADFRPLLQALRGYDEKQTATDNPGVTLNTLDNSRMPTTYIAFGTAANLLGQFAISRSHKEDRLIFVEPTFEVDLNNRNQLSAFIFLSRSNLVGRGSTKIANYFSLPKTLAFTEQGSSLDPHHVLSKTSVTLRWALAFSEAGNQLLKEAYKIPATTLLIERSNLGLAKEKRRIDFCKRLMKCTIQLVLSENEMPLPFQKNSFQILVDGFLQKKSPGLAVQGFKSL